MSLQDSSARNAGGMTKPTGRKTTKSPKTLRGILEVIDEQEERIRLLEELVRILELRVDVLEYANESKRLSFLERHIDRHIEVKSLK